MEIFVWAGGFVNFTSGCVLIVKRTFTLNS
jgi:hypothetical protein